MKEEKMANRYATYNTKHTLWWNLQYTKLTGKHKHKSDKTEYKRWITVRLTQWDINNMFHEAFSLKEQDKIKKKIDAPSEHGF